MTDSKVKNKIQYDIHYKQNRMQQLKAFIMTVKGGTFKKAAELMNLEQSSVFKQVKSLEAHLGVQLFYKNGRNTELSPEGKIFYELSLPVFNATEDIFNVFHKKNIKIKNKLRIASNHVGISYILPDYIKRYKLLYPDTHFYIHNLSKEETDERLLNNEIDIAIYPTTEQSQDFDFIPIRTHKPILLLKKNDVLFKTKTKDQIKMDDIIGRHIVRIDPKLITLLNFEQVIKHYKLETTITFENADWEILKQFVRNEIGLALISDICIQDNDPDLVAIPMSEYFGEMVYYLYTKKTIQPSINIKQFINLIYAK